MTTPRRRRGDAWGRLSFSRAAVLDLLEMPAPPGRVLRMRAGTLLRQAADVQRIVGWPALAESLANDAQALLERHDELAAAPSKPTPLRGAD